jgi:hypothetical protein
VNRNLPFPHHRHVSCIRTIPILSLLPCLLIVRSAGAQGTARSMDVDVSIRSAALGGASSALFWGEERDHWANPALLGYESGIRYEHGETQLVPGLASDVTFTTDVLKVGGSGFGLVFSGQPLHHGGVHLDYGSSETTDASGNPIGTFDGYERVRSWGFGVSALQALDAVLGRGGRTSRLARWGDVSYGMNFKDVTVALSPTGSSTARDLGILLRLTPLDGLTDPRLPPIRVDLAYGHSELSYNDDAAITFDTGGSYQVSHHVRDGGGVHVAADPLRGHWPTRGIGAWLGPGLEPLLSFAYTFDSDRIDPNDDITKGSGVEFTVARVFSYRTGHYEDPLGNINGDTSGWSVGLPVGRWGGGYYEEATWPQASGSGLPDVHRKGFGVWVDAMAIWRSTRGSQGP